VIVRTHQTTGTFMPTFSRAHYSDCEQYRYYLSRVWDFTRPLVNYLMLNPSTATEEQNDPTLARCQERAQRLEYGGFVVTNLFAFRATDPKDMKRAADPVGPDNNAQIAEAAMNSPVIILGWGATGGHRERARQVIAMLEPYHDKLYYLRLTGTGYPQHPLYIGYDQQPQKFYTRKDQV